MLRNNAERPRPRIIIPMLLAAFLALTLAQGTLILAIIGAVIVIATLFYIIYHDTSISRRAKKRYEQLGNPCTVYFLIPEAEKAELPYVQQDDREHRTDCLVLPADSEVLIELWIQPKLVYQQLDMYIGCEGVIGEKPEAVKYYNPFIYRGKKEASPDTDEKHYIDHHRYYHVRGEGQSRVPTEVYVAGFMFQTHAPGKYKTQILFHSLERNGITTLHIAVENTPSTATRCIDHEDCNLKPIWQNSAMGGDNATGQV